MYTDIINVSDLTGNRIFQRKKWNLRGEQEFQERAPGWTDEEVDESGEGEEKEEYGRGEKVGGGGLE